MRNGLLGLLKACLAVLAWRATAHLGMGEAPVRDEAWLHLAKMTAARAAGKACTAHRDVEVICGFGVQRAVLALQQHLVQTCSPRLSKQPVCLTCAASVARPKLS